LENSPTIAIIGAGPLGRSLALRAARAGFRVFLEDVMPSNLHHAQELIRQELSAAALPTVTFVSTVEDAVRTADLVIDCVPDELESKLEILWLLDRMAPPHAVFATPTTTQSIADLAACTYRPGKCVAIAAEPAALARSDGSDESSILLRTTATTAPETIALVRRFWSALGFHASFECVQ
jgi:3-hydroxybutyryl-CoA dehydrogenase